MMVFALLTVVTVMMVIGNTFGGGHTVGGHTAGGGYTAREAIALSSGLSFLRTTTRHNITFPLTSWHVGLWPCDVPTEPYSHCQQLVCRMRQELCHILPGFDHGESPWDGSFNDWGQYAQFLRAG